MEKVKILFVDDEIDFFSLFLEELRLIEYQVCECTCVRDAIRLIQKNKYNLVITDIQMGKYTGFYLQEWINSNQPHIPVIFVTGTPKEDWSGIKDYHQKHEEVPCFFKLSSSIDDLLELIKNTINSNKSTPS